MRLIIILVVTLLSTALGVPFNTKRLEDALLQAQAIQTDGQIAVRNSVLENLILELIEGFRETMVTGSDSIPVLEPFKLDHLHIDEQTLPYPGSHVTINDLVVNNLSTFEINSLSVNLVSFVLQTYTVEVDLEIPQIDVEAGGYDLLINAMGYTIFGTGRANVKVIRPKVKSTFYANIRIGIISGITVNLNSCDIEFSLGAFEPEITGLFHDDSVSNFLSIFLQHLVPDLVVFYQAEINSFLSEIVLEIARDFLG